MKHSFVAIGALSAALSIALGAFGAHALRASLDAQGIALWQTAAQYHLPHAIALVVVGALQQHADKPRCLFWVGVLLLVGQLLFSGSLYLLAISGVRALGAVTPLGGTAMMLGWLLLVVCASRNVASR